MSHRVAVAASTSLRPLVTGPPTRGEVIAAFPGAVYVAVEADIGVLALVATEAVALPNAAIVRDDGASLRRVAARADAHLGGGAITVGGLTADPTSWWEPVPELEPVTPAELDAGRAAVARHVPAWPPADAPSAERLRTGHAELERALAPPRDPSPALSDGAAVLTPPTERLIGLGAGLTPAGDDLLGGVMAALRVLGEALGVPAAVDTSDHLAATVASRTAHTTAVSAALLRQAARGAVAAPLGPALRATAGKADAGGAIRELLAIGHSSGHDLAAGLLLGAQAVSRLHRETARPSVG